MSDAAADAGIGTAAPPVQASAEPIVVPVIKVAPAPEAAAAPAPTPTPPAPAPASAPAPAPAPEMPKEAPSPASDPRPAETPVVPVPPAVTPQPVETPAAPQPQEVPAQPAQEAASLPRSEQGAGTGAPATPAALSIKDRLYAALEKIRFNKRRKLDKIVQLAAEKGSIKNDDVQKLVRVSDSTARRYLKQLVQEGRLTVTMTGNDAFYAPR